MPLLGLRELKFRNDPDLFFLKYCEDDDLKTLVDILTTNKGKHRWSEELTGDQRFKESNGNYREIWDLIGAELQTFGADGICTAWRGHGVPYREILKDVCKRMKAGFDESESTVENELKLLEKVIAKSIDGMSDEQLKDFAESVGVDVKTMTPAAVMAALQVAIRQSGFTAYKLSLIVANSVVKFFLGRGLPLAVNAGLTRYLAVFAGPIGWAVSAFLTVPMLTGPAYRVTVPACINVAYMRQKYLNKDFI